MARKPLDYWEKRQTELMKRLEKGTENTIKGLIESYEQATKNINKEISKIYKNYSKSDVLDKKVLNQLLNKKETDTYRRNLLTTINNNIKNEDIKQKMLLKYNSSAYSFRISRYEQLQESIDLELKKLADIEQQITEIRYVETLKEGYYHNIYNVQKATGLGFNFSQIDNKTINLLLNEKWTDNANFSQRIWKNSEKLGNYLRTQLTADTMSGKTIQKIASELSSFMNVGLYNATTLVRTEVNHFANEAEMLSYEELDIEKYKFIATLDNVTCKHCAELDNKVFNLKDRKTGKNYPPIHPNDRCTTVAVFDENVTEGLQRRAKDENENTIFVPQDMNYNEWKEKYVTNTNNGGIIKMPEKKTIKSAKTMKMWQNKENIPDNIKDFYNYYKKKTDKILTPVNLNRVLGYDKLPTIVSKEEFYKIAENNKYGVLERGFKTGEGTLSIDKIIDNYKSKEFYVGEGIFGSGTYTAYGKNAHKIALSYAIDKEKFSVENNVVKYLLKDDAKVIKYDELRRMRDKELEELIKDNGFKDYFDVIENGFKNVKTTEISKYIMEMQDAGVYASIKGYDAIDTYTENAWGDENTYIVILNRKKMIMFD